MPVRYYTLGGNTLGVRQGASVSWLYGDHLGSTSANSGAAATSERYYAYGKDRGTGNLPTDHRFTGQISDASGLVFMNARYYDPVLGSLISPDTVVPEPGQPEGYNRYAYANGNPLRFSDPSGHFTEEQLIEWYGENWRSRFSQSWQNLLLDSNGDQLGAQFGDVVEAAWGDNPKQQFVIVNGYNQMPALWHTSAKVAWDLAASGGAETSSLGLYRTVAGGMGFSNDNLLGASMRVRSGESLATIAHIVGEHYEDISIRTYKCTNLPCHIV